MLRTAALGLLALLPGVARADVGVALRRVPVHVTLTVDRDYPEFAFLLVGPEPKTVLRVWPTAADPAVARSGDAGGSFFACEVYVVPKAALVKFDRALPPAQWFAEKEGSRYLAGQIHARPILDVFDNRDRIEKSYRVQQVGDAFRMDLVSENQGNRWVKGAWVGICCGLPALTVSAAVALAGVWAARRGKRRGPTQGRPPEP